MDSALLVSLGCVSSSKKNPFVTLWKWVQLRCETFNLKRKLKVILRGPAYIFFINCVSHRKWEGDVSWIPRQLGLRAPPWTSWTLSIESTTEGMTHETWCRPPTSFHIVHFQADLISLGIGRWCALLHTVPVWLWLSRLTKHAVCVPLLCV